MADGEQADQVALLLQTEALADAVGGRPEALPRYLDGDDLDDIELVDLRDGGGS